MSEIGVIVIVGIVCALLGLATGIGLHRHIGSSAARVRSLEEALKKAEESNNQYKNNVAEHFSETANLINDLTRRYKDVHDHLAMGADQLCRDKDGAPLLSGTPIELKIEPQNRSTDTGGAGSSSSIPQPPLDYAPKNDNENVSTLAEDYGLEKVKLHEETGTGAFSASEQLATDDYAPQSDQPSSASTKAS